MSVRALVADGPTGTLAMMLFTPLPHFPSLCVGSFFSSFLLCLFLLCFVVVITCKRVSLVLELAFIDKQIGPGCCDPYDLGPEIASLLN